MDGFQGADHLRIKLKRLDEWTARRRNLAAVYRAHFAEARIDLPRDGPDAESVYHLFPVFVDDRDAVVVAPAGVATGIHYPVPVHLQKPYADLGYEPGVFPNTERACRRTLSLPIYPELRRDHVEFAASALAEIVGPA